VLFLLAIDAGLPEIADELFAALRNVTPAAGGGTGEGNATLVDLVKNQIGTIAGRITSTSTKLIDLDPSDSSTLFRWKRIDAWLRPHPEAEPVFNPTPAQLAQWEPRVTRFSFRAQA
jgi:hypothetical protein